MFHTKDTKDAKENRQSCFLFLCALCVLCVKCLFWPVPAVGDQYQSETKELEQAPPQQQKQDTQKLLEITTDPYAKALLLRDMAMQAAERKDYMAAARYLEQAIGQNSLSGPALQ